MLIKVEDFKCVITPEGIYPGWRNLIKACPDLVVVGGNTVNKVKYQIMDFRPPIVGESFVSYIDGANCLVKVDFCFINFSGPRLILEAIPPRYVYETDGKERKPVKGDWIFTPTSWKQVESDAWGVRQGRCLCFKRIPIYD